MSGAAPVGRAEFAQLMAAVGPFERHPRLAVAVSGGADSLALAILADRWARARGGEAVALTVDHRLRRNSSAEAGQVARWLARRRIACRRLVWQHARGRPASALQARARQARYALLNDWCRRHGVLHLALAHHAGDQAETVVMRLSRGGGIDGLAGMPAVASRDGVRLVRPLLPLPPARLAATLRAFGQDWIEDPSNRNEAFERIRWRKRIAPALTPAIASAALEIALERRRREYQVAEFLTEACMHPAGFLVMPLDRLAGAAPDLAQRALARMLIAVGGDLYPARQEALERLLAALRSGSKGRTLGGCRLLVREDRLLVCREPAAAAERLTVKGGTRVRWDGRFDLVVFRSGVIARLGEAGWARLSAEERRLLPRREAALALPWRWRGGKPADSPCLGHGKDGLSARYRPNQPLVPGCFTVAKLNVNII